MESSIPFGLGWELVLESNRAEKEPMPSQTSRSEPESMSSCLVYKADIASITDTKGQDCCSSRSLEMMQVKSVFFCMKDSYLCVEFEKEEKVRYAFGWKQVSKTAHNQR